MQKCVAAFHFDNQHVTLRMKNNYKILCKIFCGLDWLPVYLYQQRKQRSFFKLKSNPLTTKNKRVL